MRPKNYLLFSPNFDIIDDELLDVNGTNLSGMTVAEVGQVIRNCPTEFIATVRPITSLKRLRPPEDRRISYVTVLPYPASAAMNLHPPTQVPILEDSLEDMGNYDDEDEEDIPPPLPVWTEDVLAVDPPPVIGQSRNYVMLCYSIH